MREQSSIKPKHKTKKSAKSKPRYSVVIPAYNEAEYIAGTITSLQQQDFPDNLEIIVVDNNCTDSTGAISRRLGARVINEPNPGVCWARQKGTLEAKGEIIISTDADTTFPAGWIAAIDQSFNNDARVVAVAGPCEYQNGPAWAKSYTMILFGIVKLLHAISGQTIYASATNIAFKKSAWTEYDTRLTQGGDELDLLRRLRAKGRISFNSRNLTYTSSRRLSRGFLYNLVVTFFIYYIVEYNLSRRLKRPIFGNAPAFRDDQTAKGFGYAKAALLVLLIGLAFINLQEVHSLIASYSNILKSVYSLTIG